MLRSSKWNALYVFVSLLGFILSLWFEYKARSACYAFCLLDVSVRYRAMHRWACGAFRCLSGFVFVFWGSVLDTVRALSRKILACVFRFAFRKRDVLVVPQLVLGLPRYLYRTDFFGEAPLPRRNPFPVPHPHPSPRQSLTPPALSCLCTQGSPSGLPKLGDALADRDAGGGGAVHLRGGGHGLVRGRLRSRECRRGGA